MEEKEMNEMQAYELAMKLYEGFFNTLMQAVETSMGNFKAAKAKIDNNLNQDPVEKAYASGYYGGKLDAFREIAGRLQKEYGLAGQDLENYLKVINDNTLDEKYGDAVRHKWEDFVYRTLKEKKNSEVDGIFPDNQYRGRRVFDKIMRLKGKLADLLEHYGWEGFRLGRKFEEDIEKMDESDKFDPDKFSKTCIDAFVPEDYRDF